MAINFKNYKPNITERRTTTYKIESPTKVTVDNSDSVRYNGNKEIKPTISPSTDFAKQWEEKHKDTFKYAGDSAKKSIHAGLNEAPDYMKDADEGTSFENVQTASVKRHLAKDANDDKLFNASIMEMIGHLSRENKEPYLKHAQPLQKYIDAKDEFDFKQNNYTTTENVDKTPNEDVRTLQRELNEAGYTDKFGQKLKEDGIYAGKTAYADDRRRADNPSVSSYSTNKKNKKFSAKELSKEEIEKIGKYVYGDDYNSDVLALNFTDDGKVATHPTTVNASGPMGPVYEYVDDILNKVNNSTEQIKTKANTFFDEYIPYYSSKNDEIRLSDSGVENEKDKKFNTVKKTMLRCLSANWYGTSYNNYFQEYIHEQADRLRLYDDNSFKKAVLLNNSEGASTLGHNAVMLINKDNEGLVFSFYPTNSNFTKSMLTTAEVRFGVLSSKEVDDLLNANNKNTLFLVASDNTVVQEKYDRVITYNLTGTGYNMYNAAVALYDCPSYYSLAVRHCDNIAVELLKEGGIDIARWVIPNWTYENN